MKILHVCLSSAITEGMSYQDNLLAIQNIKDGHAVTVISDCHKYNEGKIIDTPPEDRVLSNGIHLIRLKYNKIINPFISGKIRKVSDLYSIITQISPDIILYHGVIGWEMLTVAKYKKNHPNIKLYFDSHEDLHNSATNFISKYVQYQCFNKTLVKKAIPYIDKIFYLSYECKEFLSKLYEIPDDMMEYYPLGGVVFSDTMRQEKRNRIRAELHVEDDDILLVHTGKMDQQKRTEEIIEAFRQVPDRKLVLVLIGLMHPAVKDKLTELIGQDDRIQYLGWKDSDELLDYLCGCDLYVQPGSQSVTMQNALCCGCAVALYPYKSHRYLLKKSAFYVKTMEDMKRLFERISYDSELLERKRNQSFMIAKKMLDYRILAARLYK